MQINPLTHGTQVSPNSITSASELDSFKNEIFSKQQEIQSFKEDILVLGDLIRDLESKMRHHREAEQIKQRILLLKKKMNDHMEKLLSHEDEVRKLQVLYNAKQSQRGKEAQYESHDDDNDSEVDTDKYRKRGIEGEKKVNEYYVQIGAWVNHKYAQKMLEKIINYYPEAYIVTYDTFNKLRIPGVLSKKQGVIMSKDIEKKFNLKPIVVLKKQ